MGVHVERQLGREARVEEILEPEEGARGGPAPLRQRLRLDCAREEVGEDEQRDEQLRGLAIVRAREPALVRQRDARRLLAGRRRDVLGVEGRAERGAERGERGPRGGRAGVRRRVNGPDKRAQVGLGGVARARGPVAPPACRGEARKGRRAHELAAEQAIASASLRLLGALAVLLLVRVGERVLVALFLLLRRALGDLLADPARRDGRACRHDVQCVWPRN